MAAKPSKKAAAEAAPKKVVAKRNPETVKALTDLGVVLPKRGRKKISDGGTDKRREAAMKVLTDTLAEQTLPVALVPSDMTTKELRAVIPAGSDLQTVQVKMTSSTLRRWVAEWAKAHKHQAETVRGVNIILK
jgi:hypothetical protein